jgi:enamine deaminase RidA (YjgF/YER057c/UK114 family)
MSLWLVAACGPKPAAPEAPRVTREYLNPPGLRPSPMFTNVVKVGELVFIAAQISTNEAGEVIAKGDPEGQVRQVWRNLDIAMKAAGGSINDIVATWTYCTSVEVAPFVAKVRAELFPKNPPVTSRPIVVNQLTLGPGDGTVKGTDFLVSISAIAVLPRK